MPEAFRNRSTLRSRAKPLGRVTDTNCKASGRGISRTFRACRHNLTRSFKALLRHAELPKSTRFHDLRHTCATLLLGRSFNGKFVQELLGHATIAITLDTYSHVMPGMADHTTAMKEALNL